MMSLQTLKSRFAELQLLLYHIDAEKEVLEKKRDNITDEMHKVATEMWEIEDPAGFARWKKGPLPRPLPDLIVPPSDDFQFGGGE